MARGFRKPPGGCTCKSLQEFKLCYKAGGTKHPACSPQTAPALHIPPILHAATQHSAARLTPRGTTGAAPYTQLQRVNTASFGGGRVTGGSISPPQPRHSSCPSLQTRKHCVRQARPLCLVTAEPFAFQTPQAHLSQPRVLSPSGANLPPRPALPFWRGGKAQTHLQHNSHALCTSSSSTSLPALAASAPFYAFPHTIPLSLQLPSLCLHLSPAFHLLGSWQPLALPC